MIPELGHYALILSLSIAMVMAIFPLIGAHTRNPAWIGVAVPAAHAQFLFMLISFLCLTYAFLEQDFSVAYVAGNSNISLPWEYRISAVWSAHEGSLLLWAFILSSWILAVSIFSRQLPTLLKARVLGVLAFVLVGFLLFMLTTSNPFNRLLPAPLDGHDLNPLLQDPGLIVHPPMLYMGYVGLAVPFAFAVAALLGGRIDSAWIRWTRPWTLLAWVFLTLGITLGSWWAYYELGWGGWWFWDPVENASFMPWLVATALMHSLAVTEQRGAFRAWSVLLAIIGFSLSLLGTFLVRSGVLVSVHAFASDPERGVFILLFLAVVIGSALLLFCLRAGVLSGGGQFEVLSKEMLLLVNNVLLVAASATILMGTLYPLLMDALDLGKISVGPPYFNSVFIPLMAPIALIIGIGPIIRWKHEGPQSIAKRMLPAFVVFLTICLAWIAWGARGMTLISGVSFALWITASCGLAFYMRIRHSRQAGSMLSKLTPAFCGMLLAHLGVAIFIVGITVTSLNSIEADVRMSPGDRYQLAGYEVLFKGVESIAGPNYDATRGELVIFSGGNEIATLHPEKRLYSQPSQPMTEAGIDAGLMRDFYVALGDSLDDGSWALRLYHKPMIRWIWLGGLFMALGGIVASMDRRYRRPIVVTEDSLPESDSPTVTTTLTPSSST